MSNIDRLIPGNDAFVAGFSEGDLGPEPALQVAIVTCMDCRVDVPEALGLRAGDVHVIRNAGGVVTEDVLRSLAISQSLLGTREIMLVRHTRCGLQAFNDEQIGQAVLEVSGERPPWAAGSFQDLEEDLLAALDEVRDCSYLAHTAAVRGFVYEVETGRLREITRAV